MYELIKSILHTLCNSNAKHRREKEIDPFREKTRRAVENQKLHYFTKNGF